MNKKAFTLIELLAVISIIAILGILTVPNVLEYFNESKRQTMIVQESKLVESGDILVRDFCKKPINDNYRLQCDEVFKSLNSTAEENVVDNDPLTYTRYICVSTLKDKKYYSEKLQYSGEECSGVVVYRIDEETDIQKDSFSVIKCGSGYKTLFENESVEEFEENPEDKTRADELIAVFKECFPAGSDEEEDEPSNTPKEYQLTINFTEHNQYGQQVAETISEKVRQGNRVEKNVPPYKSYDGTNEEHFTPFVHGSSDDVLNNSGNKVKPTIVDNKLNFIMPASNVTINIAYSINQYTVTFNHIDAVLGTNTIGGQNYNSNSYKLFNGESVKIPYKEIPNFKIVSHSNGTQKDYELKEHDNKTIDIEYQQINFNVAYDSNGGTACATTQKEYKKNFGTLCTTTRTGYRFQTWDVDGEAVNSETKNKWYKDITLSASWDKNKYYVRYNCNGGTPSTTYESEHYYDTPSKLAANQCKKEGHYFSKWTSEGGTEPSYTNEKDIMNLTNTHLGTVNLFASYSPHYVTVIYNPKDATLIKFKGNVKTTEEFKLETQYRYYYNELTTTGLADVQNSGYIYLERVGYKPTRYWYSDSIKLSELQEVSGKTLAEHFELDISNKNEILNIYPEWEIINYTITYNLNGGSNPNGVKTSYTVESNTYNLPTPTKTGYTFAGWYTTSDFSGSAISHISKGSTGNKTLYAKWNPNIYKVTLNNQNATTAGTPEYWYLFNTTKNINGETVYYYTNQECTTPMINYKITLPQKVGYTFGGYYTGQNGTGIQYINSSGFAVNNLYSTKTENTTLYAKWIENEYIITYYLGNATTTNGNQKLGTTKCKYGTTCKLTKFEDFGIAFPHSSKDKTDNNKDNYGWSFYGWDNTNGGLTRDYTNGIEFTYELTSDLNLYAIGKRNLHINSGIAPSKSIAELTQYWNPYSTNSEYLTNVILPESTDIGNNWTFIGYKAGSSTANSTVTFNANEVGKEIKASYNVWPYIRSVYNRTITINYNGNGETGGSTSRDEKTQYYNSGFGFDGANTGATLSQVTFELKNNGFTKTNYKFVKWAEKSATGTQYSEKASYPFSPNVNSSATSITMYATWELADSKNPTCVIKVASSGVTIETNDDVGVESWDLTTSSTASYKKNSKLDLKIDKYYGYVKDTSGKTGKCNVDVENIFKNYQHNCSSSNINSPSSACQADGSTYYSDNCSSTCTSWRASYMDCWYDEATRTQTWRPLGTSGVVDSCSVSGTLNTTCPYSYVQSGGTYIASCTCINRTYSGAINCYYTYCSNGYERVTGENMCYKNDV